MDTCVLKAAGLAELKSTSSVSELYAGFSKDSLKTVEKETTRVNKTLRGSDSNTWAMR